MILVVDSCAWLFFDCGYLEISVLAKRAENKNSCTVFIAWVKGKYFGANIGMRRLVMLELPV